MCITTQGCKHKQRSMFKVQIFQPAVLLNHSKPGQQPKSD